MKWIQSRTDFVKNSLAVFVVLLVSVIGVKLLTGSNAATGATLSLTSSAASLTPGSNVSITIHEDSGTDPVNSVQAALNYDSTQLQYVSLTEGATFEVAAATSTSTPGVIRVARATHTPVSGGHDVVTLNFKVLATSGSVGLTFDKNFSLVVRSTDDVNILALTTDLTLPVSGGSTGASASMSLSPATGTAAAGSNITVTVRENSGSTPVNSVQSAVLYNSSQLQYVSMTEGGSFTNQVATDTATAGRVRVARAVQAGSVGISGDNPIVTLTFKVLATSGTTSLSIDKTQSIVVDAVTNANILATVAGNSFTVQSTNPSGATLSMSPTSGTYVNGSTISVVVKATSTSSALTTVEATLNYPASQLQYVSTTEGGVFTTAQRTNTATAGVVDIIRSLPGGNAGVTGTNPVVTVNFKVIGTSGTAPVTFGTTSAVYDDSGTGTNILDRTSSTSATYTIGNSPPPPPPPPAGSATLSLSPASGTFSNGSTVAVIIKETSSTSAITTVEAAVNYPASQLQFINATEGGVFTTAQRTNSSTAGLVDIIRSLPGGNAGVTGTNPVVTLNFKVIGTGGTAALTYASSSAVYDDSGTGTNILSTANSTAASYTIGASASCSANPSTPGAPTRTASNYTTLTFNWGASSPAANCTLAGYHIFRMGVKVADVTSGTSYTDSGLTSGTSYPYSISAFDTAGHTSPTSANTTMVTKTDDMAPTTPTGVTATAPNASQVNLAWSPSTDFPNPGGVGVASYNIYRNNSTTPTYTTTNTTFTDSNVSSNTTYSYTITAVDRLGNEGSPSNVVTAKTAAPTCSTAPSVPTGLTAGTKTMTTADMSWSASTAGSGCTLAGYKIYRNAVFVTTSATASFHDIGLSPQTSYNYTVAAYDSSGNNSAQSSPLTIVTAADTTAPTAPTGVTAVAVSGGRVNLAWTASTDNVGVTGYKIYRGGTVIFTVSGTTLTYADTTVQDNQDYAYNVSAIDAAGNESTHTAATPNPIHTPVSTDTQAPTAPSSLHATTITTNSVALAWTASTDNVKVTGYHVYRGTTLLGDATGTTYASLNLTANTTYTYTVKAFDAAGNTSPASNSLTVVTLKPVGTLIGDLDLDGDVDLSDLSTLASHYGEKNVPPLFGDLDADGDVDLSDLSTLASHYGETL